MERAKVLTSNFEPVDGDLEVAGAEHGVGEGDDARVALHGQSEQVVDEQAPEGGGGVDLHQEDGQVVHVEVLVPPGRHRSQQSVHTSHTAHQRHRSRHCGC